MTKRNRCLCLFLTMAVCLTIFNIGTVFADGTTALTGTGTSTDPYLIGTLDELKAFRDLVNNGTACGRRLPTAVIGIGLKLRSIIPVHLTVTVIV